AAAGRRAGDECQLTLAEKELLRRLGAGVLEPKAHDQAQADAAPKRSHHRAPQEGCAKASAKWRINSRPLWCALRLAYGLAEQACVRSLDEIGGVPDRACTCRQRDDWAALSRTSEIRRLQGAANHDAARDGGSLAEHDTGVDYARQALTHCHLFPGRGCRRWLTLGSLREEVGNALA